MKLAKTPLHGWHVAQGANMAEFGGYHMPLWYATGAKKEHRAVITGAGLFDTSHMAVVTLTGPAAESLLQTCFSRDLRFCIGKDPGPLIEGRSAYGLFLTDKGTVLDDAIVSLLGPDRYMVVVNSGMGEKIAAHLGMHAGAGVEISDHTGLVGKIDLQGPASARIIGSLLKEEDSVLDGMGYFSFKGDIFSGASSSVQLTDGTELLLSRTGYTGEFGFELYVRASDTISVWEALLSAGKSCEITACGLAARDSLRAGAVLPLSHQDIGDWPFADTPWSFVLPWKDSGAGFTKSFIGAEAVSRLRHSSYTYAFAGYDPRKITVTPETAVLTEEGENIGSVLTCTTDMAIGRVDGKIVSIATPESSGRPADFQAKGLSCGFVKTMSPCGVGQKVQLVEGKRKIQVEIRSDIRPDRTARRSMLQMRRKD